MTNTDTLRVQLHRSALAGMVSRPKKLSRALAYQAEDEGPEAEPLARDEDFRSVLRSALSTDPLVELWRKQLTHWDYAEKAGWSDTEPRTDGRREEVLSLLGLAPETAALLTSLVPVPKASSTVVISDTFTPWYTSRAALGRSWYWSAYNRVLEDKGWSAEAVAGLDQATDRVVERLADPTAEVAYQSKGLVVGHVQSGKTANFTGVVAKALDAGYRLVIVLGGTLNLLRAQTQRRLDMELVGRENILRGAAESESDYADDPAWINGGFLSHGGMPSALGAFDIVRMTTRDKDYHSLDQGIVALEAEKQEPSLPLHDPRNLHRSHARLMVVKKNKPVLDKLLRDLNKIRTPLSEIPVLIIDDESDEASVNTANRRKPDATRTAINHRIAELLRMLPRAQYVGYTATPFANVFIDPSDTEDIFPKDFIVALPRPEGYMGVQDFHDLDSPVAPEDRTVANSNELAHVRDIRLSDDDDRTVLREAIDMFVLTAAMKLYRVDHDALDDRFFLHHTMLVHESVRTKDHYELSELINRLWEGSGYNGAGGHERLRKLFDSDIAPVSRVRAGSWSLPETYDDLAPYVGAAVMRVGGEEQPTIVVNGDKDKEYGEADFDRRPLWKIIVGGQKLARGFTVEGLTITYYRRRANNASTLLQMGRWFGFRKGYRDLVRLYVGRGEKAGAKEVDLYEAFEAICRDEESFRSQLEQYATWVDGRPQVTPADVPPLVAQHLPWLLPTSKNKMYNTRVVELASPGKWEEPTAYPTDSSDLAHNTGLWLPVLESLDAASTFSYHYDTEEHERSFEARTGLLGPGHFLELADSMRWTTDQQFAPLLKYLHKISEPSAGMLDDWLVLAPQHTTGRRTAHLGDSSRTYSWFARARRRETAFGAISEPRHRAAALRIAGALPPGGNRTTEAFVRERRGVVALYPVVESRYRDAVESSGRVSPEKTVLAFSFVAPASARSSNGKVVWFTTVDSTRESRHVSVR
ncbi:Z1 domain-containing protein [Streptomyces sp. NRRL F-5630]|uniref:Z1 domain-containing protein n=1 Tax=Streptomyces sp. NRRL F-5630 TaxID=1463864 RepID=UPI003EBC80B4